MSALIPLDNLAGRINAEHDAAHAAARSAIEHAVACGRLLIEAKARVAHGQWLPWVDRHLAFGARQAQNYMRVAENAAALLDANAKSTSHLTIDGALKLLATPKEEIPEPKPPASLERRRHDHRDMTMAERWKWFEKFEIDRAAWALYLHADRRLMGEILEFTLWPERRLAAYLKPRRSPLWFWNMGERKVEEHAAGLRFDTLVMTALPRMVDASVDATRHHACHHATYLAKWEGSAAALDALDAMGRDMATRVRHAVEAAAEPLSELPFDLVAALSRTARWLALNVLAGYATEPRNLVMDVGAMLVAGADEVARYYAEQDAAKEPDPGLVAQTDMLRNAAEVYLTVTARAADGDQYRRGA